jgi:predicted CXXCH cytochrome family protein
MKKLVGIGIILAAGVLGAAGLVAMMGGQGMLPPQPIAFNHRLHLERVQGIECQDCHQYATSETFAGLPSKHVCFGCHDPDAGGEDAEADARKPQFATLMAFSGTEGDIPWHRVTACREDVFFSHRRHVKVAEIDCRQCHSEIPDRTSPPTRGPIEMAMSTCIECHRRANSSVDCISCHR